MRVHACGGKGPTLLKRTEREFFIDNLLVRVHMIIVMITWTGLAPWEFEFPLPGSLTSAFLVRRTRYTREKKTRTALGFCCRTSPRSKGQP